MADRAAEVERERPLESAATVARPVRRSAGCTSLALAALASLILGAIAFVPALQNEFLYDDLPIIVENSSVIEPGPWYRFWLERYWPPGTSIDKLYRPLTIFSYRLNHVLAGGDTPDPWSFHLVNLVLHAVASAGVAILAYRLTGRSAAAWIAGTLFAAHPLHTESVATGYGRAELLAGVFGVWLLARHVRTGGDEPPRRARFYFFSALLYLAAVMSKEHALFLWPAVLLIDVWPRRSRSAPGADELNGAAPKPGLIQRWRRAINESLGPRHVGYALATAVFFLLRFRLFKWAYVVEPERVRFWEAPMRHATPIQHLLTPFRLLWTTAELLVYPPRLCPLWSIPALPLADRLAPDVLAGIAILIVLLVLTLRCWRRGHLEGALIMGMLIVLAIPLQALPVANWYYAERWLYLPTVFMAVLLAAACGRLAGYLAPVAAALAIGLLPATWSYCGAYRDILAMTGTTLQRQPDNYQGYRSRAPALHAAGRYAEVAQLGLEMLERFGEIEDAYLTLAHAYLALGDGRSAHEALENYKRLRGPIPAFGTDALERQIQALIEAEQAQSPGSTAPASLPADNPPH